MPVRLIYIDDQGREWLVRDGVVQERKSHALALGDHYTRFRVFDLREPRLRKVYRFRDGETHGANGASIELQFLNATTVERSERQISCAYRDQLSANSSSSLSVSQSTGKTRRANFADSKISEGPMYLR